MIRENYETNRCSASARPLAAARVLQRPQRDRVRRQQWRGTPQAAAAHPAARPAAAGPPPATPAPPATAGSTAPRAPPAAAGSASGNAGATGSGGSASGTAGSTGTGGTTSGSAGTTGRGGTTGAAGGTAGASGGTGGTSTSGAAGTIGPGGAPPACQSPPTITVQGSGPWDSTSRRTSARRSARRVSPDLMGVHTSVYDANMQLPTTPDYAEAGGREVAALSGRLVRRPLSLVAAHGHIHARQPAPAATRSSSRPTRTSARSCSSWRRSAPAR